MPPDHSSVVTALGGRSREAALACRGVARNYLDGRMKYRQVYIYGPLGVGEIGAP